MAKHQAHGRHRAPRHPLRTPIIAGALIGGVLAAAVAVTAPQPQEDEPGWDCHTMGNRVCGPGYDLTHEDTSDADAYGCYPSSPAPSSAWVSDRTPDGLCHDGPHGKPYWATGAYSGNDVLRRGTAAQSKPDSRN